MRSPSKALPAFITLSRWAIGAMFLWTGLPKLLHPDEFLVQIQAYAILSPKLAGYLAAALPGVEILLGICLIAGLFTTASFLAATLVFTMFAGAITIALTRGLAIDCGCSLFGAGQITKLTLLRSCLLLLWGLTAYLLSLRLARRAATTHTNGPDTSTDAPPQPIEAAPTSAIEACPSGQ